MKPCAQFGAKSAATLALLLLAGLCAGCSRSHSVVRPAAAMQPAESAAIPPGSEGEEIRRGKLIFDQTPHYAAAYVGNRLSCSDCHVRSGTMPYAAPLIGVANLFPMFNKRAGHVISMQERFQECFARSENGRPLPDNSEEMRALTAYVSWLSRDGVKGRPFPGRGFVTLPALTGDPARGKSVYAEQCAGCHGKDGAGVPPVLPALWGPNSYNDGAGMNNPEKMAAFVQHNMPQNHPGTLTPQQAFDVSSFVHSMPRPKFNQAYRHY